MHDSHHLMLHAWYIALIEDLISLEWKVYLFETDSSFASDGTNWLFHSRWICIFTNLRSNFCKSWHWGWYRIKLINIYCWGKEYYMIKCKVPIKHDLLFYGDHDNDYMVKLEYKLISILQCIRNFFKRYVLLRFSSAGRSRIDNMKLKGTKCF